MTAGEDMGTPTKARGLPSRRTAARHSQRRAEIVDTAAKLFARNGYSATGIAEIGAAVGLARGALYHYITSKESLLVEINNRVMDPLLHEGSTVVALDVEPAVKVRLISEVILRQIIERPDHCWVNLHEVRCIKGPARFTLRDKRIAFEAVVADILRQGADAGAFVIAHPQYTVRAFLGMHNYTYQWAHTMPLEVAALSESYCDAFLGGIADRAAADRSRAALPDARRRFADALGEPR